jgi:hypothetical protein
MTNTWIQLRKCPRVITGSLKQPYPRCCMNTNKLPWNEPNECMCFSYLHKHNYPSARRKHPDVNRFSIKFRCVLKEDE